MYPASPGLQEPASPPYVAGPGRRQRPARGGERQPGEAAARPSGATSTEPNITGGAYDPTDIYSSQAYDYNALYGQGHCCNPLGNAGSSPPQTSIAIATFGSQDDQRHPGFQSQYPYLAYNVQEVNIDGTPSCCDAEGTMDMEWSTAMSNSFGSYQDTSKVYLYDGANFNDSTFTDMYNQMVSDNVARVFSTSWSCTEIYGCSVVHDEHPGRHLQRDGRPGMDAGRRVRRPGRIRRLLAPGRQLSGIGPERGRRGRDRAQPELRARSTTARSPGPAARTAAARTTAAPAAAAARCSPRRRSRATSRAGAGHAASRTSR